MTAERTHYFAYGSNLCPVEFPRRCPGAKPVGAARLGGWGVRFNYASTNWPGSGAADIVPAPDEEVWGLAYVVRAADIAALDHYEDVEAGGYRRIEVEVEVGGRPVAAMTYEVIDKPHAELPPTPAYLEAMLGGARHHGLPRHYLATLERRATSFNAPRT